MKSTKYHAIGTVQNSNTKIVERDNIDIPSTQIHDHSLACLVTDISISVAGLN